jgi:hypothetical protein
MPRRHRYVPPSSVAMFVSLLLSQLPARSWADDSALKVTTPVARSPVYDLSQATIFNKVLYYVNAQYFDKTRIDGRRMLWGVLDYLQRDVPELFVDRLPDDVPRAIRVRVGDQERTFPVDNVDSPWQLRGVVKDIFKFMQPNLAPVAPGDVSRRLVDIETTACNGMLNTLDPHSVLLDVDKFNDMRTTSAGPLGGSGLTIEMDRNGRIVVKKPIPDAPAIRAGIRPLDRIVRLNDESTANMTLQEVVDRLRGDVGSPVDVYVERAGLSVPKKFTIVRDYVRPPTIDPPAQILMVPAAQGRRAAKVGYFRLLSFAATAETDVAKALAFFDREKVNGIVMDLRTNSGGLYDQAKKESDYQWRLDPPSTANDNQPIGTVSYLYTPVASKRQPSVEDEPEPTLTSAPEEPEGLDDATIDYPVEFPRDLLAQTRSARRQDLLDQSRELVKPAQAEQDRKLQAAMAKLGVDWSPGPTSSVGSVETSLVLVGEVDKVTAGQTITIRGTVKNSGTAAVYRVWAVLHSGDVVFDQGEMVFGKIAPGASKTYDMTIRIPRYTFTRTDVIRAEFSGQGNLRAASAEMSLNIEGRRRPMFAYAYQTIDDVAGNRDGRVQKGERVRTLLRIKNIGDGVALRTGAMLRNGQDQPGILIGAGRFEVKDLAPGATQDFSFVYDVGENFRKDEYQLELMVADSVLGESIADKITVKIAPPDYAPATDDVSLSVERTGAPIRESPTADGRVLGHADKGSVFRGTGKISGYYRIDLEPGRPAFVAAADVSRGGSGRSTFRPTWHVTPPTLSISAPTVVSGPLVHIKGIATDDAEVRYIYAQVWNRETKLPPKKVLYLPNKGEKKRLPFEADVALWPGSNLIQFFARNGSQIQSSRSLMVLRQPAPGADQTRATTR